MWRLTQLSLDRPAATALAIAAITIALAAGLPRLETAFGYRVLIGADHPAVETLDGMIERYAGGLPTYIIWECGDHLPCESVFDTSSLEMAKGVVENLASVAGVRDVEGVPNAPLLIGANEGIAVRRFVENGLIAADARRLGRLAVADPFWVGDIVSPDGRVGAIVVQSVDTDPTTDRLVTDAVLGAIGPFEAKGFRFHLVGDPVHSVLSGRNLASSTNTLVPVTAAVILLVLYALTRSIRFSIAALLTIGVSLVWTFGALAWLGWPQDSILQILAPLLLVVGICDSVHLLSRYAATSSSPRGDTMHRWVSVAKDLSGPCVITTLTSAAAFASFIASQLDTFVRFGAISALGVVVCLALTFTLLPLLASSAGRTTRREGATSRSWEVALEAAIGVASRRAGTVLTLSVIACSVCGFGWVQLLRVDTSWKDLIGERSELIEWIRFMEERLRPSDTIELEISLPTGTQLEEPTTLLRLEALAAALSADDGIGPSTSIVDYLKRANRLLNDDRVEFEVLGSTLSRNAQLLELIAFEDPDLVDRWVGFDRRSMRMSFDMPNLEFSERASVLARALRLVEDGIPQGWSSRVSGQLAINVAWVRELQGTQLRSFPIALGIVFIMVSIFLRSPFLGAAAAFATVLPIVVTLGSMGWMGLSLDVGRAMIGAILIGIAVDDSIHLLVQYRRRLAVGCNSSEAISGAVAHVGRAIVTSSLALSLGFLTLMASAWQTISSFGFFIALAIMGALAAVLFVLPALIFLASRDD